MGECCSAVTTGRERLCLRGITFEGALAQIKSISDEQPELVMRHQARLALG
jgi:hypothetical protein